MLPSPCRAAGIALLAALSPSACSNGRSTPAALQPGLAIAAVHPADGMTDVAQRSTVALTFAEDMLPDSLESALQVLDGGVALAGSQRYDVALRQLVWTPAADLPLGALLQVALSTAAQSVGGSTLPQPFRSGFTVIDGAFTTPVPLCEEQLGARPFACVDGRGEVLAVYGSLALGHDGGWLAPQPFTDGSPLGATCDRAGNAAVLVLVSQPSAQQGLQLLRRPPYAPFAAPEPLPTAGSVIGASLVANVRGDLAVRWFGPGIGGVGGDGVLVARAQAPQWQALSLPPAARFVPRQLAVDGRGGVFTLQAGSQHLRLERHAGDGGVEATDLAATSAVAIPVGVAADGVGNCLCVWLDDDGGQGVVRSQQWLADGELLPLQEVFRGGRLARAELIGSDRGDAVVVFTQPAGGGDVLLAAQFVAGSGRWGAVEGVTPEFVPLPNGAACVLAVAATGEVWILFQRQPAGGAAELLVVRARAQRGFAAERRVWTAPPGQQFGVPAAAVDATGRAVVLFTLYQPLASGLRFLWGVSFG